MRLNTNFKLSVSHLRILFLVVNLGLAVALPAYAVYSIWPAAGDAKGVEVADPGAFVYTDVPMTGQTGAQILQGVAAFISPQPPATTPTGTDTEEALTKPTDEKAEEVKEGGPLAKDWEYTHYIAWGGDALVTLTRKEAEDAAGAAAAAAAAGGAARRPPVRRPQPRNNFNLNRGGRGQQGQKPMAAPQDKVVFYVGKGKHHVKNEELAVDFMAHMANESELIYWLPSEGPKKRYRLPYHDPNPYVIGNRESLAPMATDEEAAGEGFTRVRDEENLRDLREDEYQKVLGGLPVSDANLLKDEPADEGQPTAAGSTAAGGTAAAAAAAKFRGATGAAKPMSAAEQKELGKTLQSIEAKAKTKEEQEQLKALKDGLRGKAGTK